MDCGRFTGTVDELAEVLRRCVNHGGRSFVRCSEEASVHASTLVTTAISEDHFVLLHFQKICEQLLFNKSLMVAALRIAGSSAQILDGHIWLAEHVFACARWSKTWVRSLPWNTSAAKCDDSVSDAQSRSHQFESRSSCILELEPSWNCGFSVDLMLPWRSSGDSSDKALSIPPDPAAMALFMCSVSSITNEVLAKLHRSASRVKSEPL